MGLLAGVEVRVGFIHTGLFVLGVAQSRIKFKAEEIEPVQASLQEVPGPIRSLSDEFT